MASTSVIWVDSDDDDDDLIEIVELSPRKFAGPGPSTVASRRANGICPARTTKRKRNPVDSYSSDIEIVESPSKSAKIHREQQPLSTEADEDRAVALALQKEWEEEDAEAKKEAEENDERSVRLIERLQQMEYNMAEKRRRLAGIKDVPDDGIVFQVVINADGKTVEGVEDPDNAAHLDLVKRDFDQALAGGVKLKNVHWFVNANLEARFEKAKETLMALGIDTTERNLFHGTAATNIEPILKNGFLIPGVSAGGTRVHGASCGVGIYMATTPLTSLGYTLGATKMFMCRVITGRTTPNISMAVPKPLGTDAFEAWESGGVVVSKYVELVVPRYVVEFEMNNALQNYNYGGLAALAAVPGFAMPAMPAMPTVFPGMVVPPMPAMPAIPPIGAWGLAPLLPPPPARKPRKAATTRATKAKGKGKAKLELTDE
ncbi:hypothetical protein C8J57DRAFT_1125126 [Mycena rebaudengoi]|nr:hypothetical protein C8J57DRAFT_1125126 [Mycena rebaudengoi]